MVQSFPILGGANLDFGSAEAARRRNRYVSLIHAADTESIDCTQGIQFMAVKFDAVLGRFAAERIRINNRAARVVHSKKVMRLQLGHERSNLFWPKADYFANFRQLGRPAELAE